MLAGGLRLKAYPHRTKLKNSTAPPACNASLAQPRLNTCVPHSEALSSLSISFPLCVTRAINLHFMVTSKHTLLCLLEGESKDHRKRPLNLERMEHTLEDGTVCIEDKLLQNHNVNNFTSKDKFPGLRLDSTKFGPLWLRRLGKTVRRSEDVGVRHDGLNGCYMEPSTHAGNTSISQAAPAPVS